MLILCWSLTFCLFCLTVLNIPKFPDPKRNSAKQCASFRVGATTTILGVKRNVGTSAARNPIRANLPLQNSQNSVTPKERSVAGRFATMPKIAAAMTRSVAPNVETSAAMKTTIISRKTLERTVGTSRLRLLGPRHRQRLSAMALPGSNEQGYYANTMLVTHLLSFLSYRTKYS